MSPCGLHVLTLALGIAQHLLDDVLRGFESSLPVYGRQIVACTSTGVTYVALRDLGDGYRPTAGFRPEKFSDLMTCMDAETFMPTADKTPCSESASYA